jgi:hypothetical protein
LRRESVSKHGRDLMLRDASQRNQTYNARKISCAAALLSMRPQASRAFAQSLSIRPREVGQQLVAAFHTRIERGFCGLLAAPHRFELLIHRVADLYEIADA